MRPTPGTSYSGVEQLQRDLGAVLVNGVGQRLKHGNLGVGRQLGRGARGHDGATSPMTM